MNTTTLSRPERAGSVLGVPGRFHNAHAWDADRWSTQTWRSEGRPVEGYGADAEMRVEIRFDDQCRNGHNTFAITADVRRPGRRDIEAGGCMHDEIAQTFPELAPLIRWHMVSTDGPMHYEANTVYLAGDRDYRGLRKGERRQIVSGKTGLPAWHLVGIDADGAEVEMYALPKYADGTEAPELAHTLAWRPWCHEGEGKERQLDAARSVAVWPEATDAELTAEPDTLRAMLAARLPALLEAFKADVTRAGFVWTPATEDSDD